jgi:hypothetical protein
MHRLLKSLYIRRVSAYMFAIFRDVAFSSTCITILNTRCHNSLAVMSCIWMIPTYLIYSTSLCGVGLVNVLEDAVYLLSRYILMGTATVVTGMYNRLN